MADSVISSKPDQFRQIKLVCAAGSAKKHISPVLRSHGYAHPVLRGGEDRNQNLPEILPICRVSGPISKSRLSKGSLTGGIIEAIKAVSEAEKRAGKAEKRAAKRVDEAMRNERIAMNKLDRARSEAAAARYTLKSESDQVLISKNSLNIRGALELAAERSRSKNLVRGNNQGVSAVLTALCQSRKWQILAQQFGKDHAVMKDICRCQKSLYHSYSKDVHGTCGVDLSTVQSMSEKAALRATFTVTDIKFEG